MRQEGLEEANAVCQPAELVGPIPGLSPGSQAGFKLVEPMQEKQSSGRGDECEVMGLQVISIRVDW